MDQGLDAALDAETSALLRALGGFSTLAIAVIVYTQAPLHHLVLMALNVVAVNAEVVVLLTGKENHITVMLGFKFYCRLKQTEIPLLFV